MAMRRGRWTEFIDGSLFVPFVLILVGVRFVASTATAYAGIQGMDTRALDAAFEAYSYVMVIVLFALLAVLLSSWTDLDSSQPRFLLFFALAVATTLEWLGTVEPSLRFVGGPLGPWSDFLLGITATAAVASLTSLLAGRLRLGGLPAAALAGFQALGLGFASALLLRSLRLLDFAYLFAWSLPSGFLWLLDFGPALLLAGLAVTFWIRVGVRRVPDLRMQSLSVALPFLGALVALAAALGVLGGFVLSNALAWGGSYLVFSPAAASLPIMGFGMGAYLATACVSHGRLPAPAWRLIFGGVAIAALAGIQTSAGTLASFAGLLTGIACSARGLAGIRVRPTPGAGI